eukprot:172947-Hanusia_phi.AAC.1
MPRRPGGPGEPPATQVPSWRQSDMEELEASKPEGRPGRWKAEERMSRAELRNRVIRRPSQPNGRQVRNRSKRERRRQ